MSQYGRSAAALYGTGPGSNSRPLDQQSDSHLLPDTLPTALRGPVLQVTDSWIHVLDLLLGARGIKEVRTPLENHKAIGFIHVRITWKIT